MRLLIIEDDAEIATLLGRYLERKGFSVTVVADGEAGLQAFTAADLDPFDVVLTDSLLPRKNGYDVCAAIRQLPHGRNVGVVLMTAGFGAPRARNDATASGIDAFFTKPFILSELRDKLWELARKNQVLGTSMPPVAELADSAAPAAPAAPISSSSSSGPSALAAVRPSTQGKAQAPQPRVAAGPVGGSTQVAQLLLLAARERFEGVLRFIDGENELQIAYMRGVVVGATDNMQEHALGEWLRRQGRLTDAQARAVDERLATTRERVAEALLALGFVTAIEALSLVDLQVRARVRRALVWKGRIDVGSDPDAAIPLASQALDVTEVLLQFALEASHRDDAAAFATARAAERVERSADFNAGMTIFSALRPSSTVPQWLGERESTLAALVARTDAHEVWSLWFAGLLHAEFDPPADLRTVPRVVKAKGLGGQVDPEAVAAVSRVLLKARRATVYRLLDLPTTAATATVLQGLQRMVTTVGRDAPGSTMLGAASVSARELWTLLDEHVFVFSDEQRRARYDAALPTAVSAVRPPASKLLEAQVMVTAGALQAAELTLHEYLADHPTDVEGIALLGHIALCQHDRERGMALLGEAALRSPQSVRPVYYLALLAAREGEKDEARILLAECARRSPGNVDVLRAIVDI